MFWFQNQHPDESRVPMYLIPILFTATLSIPYLLSIKSYTIIPGASIVINKTIGQITLPLDQISVIEIINPKVLWMSIRLFGSGGLFGYFGLFYNKTYGRMRWYATQRKNAIVIITNDNKKYLITPDDLEGMINLLPKDKIHDKRIV